MQLNKIQTARAAAFIYGLQLIGEHIPNPDQELNTETVKWLQETTAECANSFADEETSFPDETRRETPESIAAWEALFKSRQDQKRYGQGNAALAGVPDAFREIKKNRTFHFER